MPCSTTYPTSTSTNGTTSKRRSVAASSPAMTADCAEITRMTLRAAYRNRVTGSRWENSLASAG